jgi:hypothetical protein
MCRDLPGLICQNAVASHRRLVGPQAGQQYRDIDSNDLSGLHEIDGGSDLGRNSPQCRPMIRRKNYDSQLTAREFLLERDILIASNQQIKSRLLGCIEQRAVLQPLPSQFIRTQYLVPP